MNRYLITPMATRKTSAARINKTPNPKGEPENNQAKIPKVAEKTITTKEMMITAPVAHPGAHPRSVSLSISREGGHVRVLP